MKVQDHLFNTLKAVIPKQFKLADIIGEILQLSPDAVYRRIRGDKELSLSELYKLCNHFNISLDAILHVNTNSMLTRYSSLNLDDFSNYYKYLDEFDNQLQMMSSEEHSELFFTAEDIPIFHFLQFPELTYFKVYSWFQTMNNLKISYEDFVKNLDQEFLKAKYLSIFNKYIKIPSTEIWTERTIDQLLFTLDYYYDIQCFDDPNIGLLICSQISELIDNFNLWTDEKKKGLQGDKYNVYLSPLNLENSFMLLKAPNKSACSLKLFTINSIVTSNEKFCKETENWILNTINKSSYLSGASARERFKFFQSTKNKVNNLIEKLQTGL